MKDSFCSFNNVFVPPTDFEGKLTIFWQTFFVLLTKFKGEGSFTNSGKIFLSSISYKALSNLRPIIHESVSKATVPLYVYYHFYSIVIFHSSCLLRDQCKSVIFVFLSDLFEWWSSIPFFHRFGYKDRLLDGDNGSGVDVELLIFFKVF